MIARTMDVEFLNRLANDPMIRSSLGGEGVLDVAVLVDNPNNIAVRHGNGAWMFHKLMPGMYEVHTMFTVNDRGKDFFQAATETLRYMFTTTDAVEILTKCPDDNKPARYASTHIGFRERFRRENAWSEGVGISYRALTIDDWFIKDDECLERGRQFHDEIEVAKVLAGKPDTVHGEDEAHDRAAGATCLMVLANNTEKAMAFYSRWAIFAGYATIEAVSRSVINIRDAIVEVRDGKMEVLKCL